MDEETEQLLGQLAKEFLIEQQRCVEEEDEHGFVQNYLWLYDNLFEAAIIKKFDVDMDDDEDRREMRSLRDEWESMARKAAKKHIKRYKRRQKFKTIFQDVIARFKREDFCWRCGNRGWWEEQINGPHNKRRVVCPNPIHLGKEFEDVESKS